MGEALQVRGKTGIDGHRSRVLALHRGTTFRTLGDAGLEVLERSSIIKGVLSAQQQGRRLVPYVELLTIAEGTGGVSGSAICWSGTAFAYQEPGKPFGEVVTRSVYIAGKRKGERELVYELEFRIPKECQGIPNAAITSEPGNYNVEPKGEGLVITPRVWALTTEFPSRSAGVHNVHNNGIPFGSALTLPPEVVPPELHPDIPSARLLWREDGASVGFVLVDIGTEHWNRHRVWMDHPASLSHPVIAHTAQA